MIQSFGNQLTDDFFNDRFSKATRRFASDLRKVIQRKLQYLHAAAKLQDLAIPSGNRLEALKGDLKGHHSIRINDQWRITFKWENNAATEVRIVGYH
jgi:proteic killer suppression protein